jgi:N-acetylglutamate synthase-like GNAT family acetyltransferase
MGVDISVDYCLVAVEEKSPVGLARLEFGEGIPYVRPVVVLPVRQGKGIGTRLLRIVIATYQEVRVVSRGPSTEFYRKLGFERMAWGDIHQPFRQECEQCPDRSECNPCPMVYRAIADEIG